MEDAIMAAERIEQECAEKHARIMEEQYLREELKKIESEYAKKHAELVIIHLYDIDCNGDPTRNSVLMKRPENLTYVTCDEERNLIYLVEGCDSDLKGSCVPYTKDCINPDLILTAQEAGEHQMLAQMLFFTPVKFHDALKNDKPRKKQFFRIQKLMAKFSSYLSLTMKLIEEEDEEKKKLQTHSDMRSMFSLAEKTVTDADDMVQ